MWCWNGGSPGFDNCDNDQDWAVCGPQGLDAGAALTDLPMDAGDDDGDATDDDDATPDDDDDDDGGGSSGRACASLASVPAAPSGLLLAVFGAGLLRRQRRTLR